MKKSMICFAMAITSLLLASCTPGGGSIPVAKTPTVAELQQKLDRQQTQLRECRSKVVAYMKNHKMAVAAIFAGKAGPKVILNKEISKEWKRIGAVVTIAAVIYAVTHKEEIKEVVKQLQIADRNIKRIKRDISATSMQLNARTNQNVSGV